MKSTNIPVTRREGEVPVYRAWVGSRLVPIEKALNGTKQAFRWLVSDSRNQVSAVRGIGGSHKGPARPYLTKNRIEREAGSRHTAARLAFHVAWQTIIGLF